MGLLDKGYVQVYTGNGKGKTSAALGIALRAAGAGYKTLIVQFMKNFPYSETKALEKFSDKIKIEQWIGDKFVIKRQPPSEDELNEAEKALKRVKHALRSEEFDIIIMDEICVSVYFKLYDKNRILEIVRTKPAGKELILTGRYCPEEIIAAADLVTEMKEIKHYYEQGVLSRKGIDS
jgi:cob(I)alamin adenosyltransferase